MGTIILLEICAVHESAYGTKRTSQQAKPMSASGGKADISLVPKDLFLTKAEMASMSAHQTAAGRSLGR
jgi:hypothetical protein